MKLTTIIALSLFVAFLMPSCDQQASSDDAQLTANFAKYKSVWYEVLNEENIDAINADYFSEDILVHMDPENIVGIDALKAYYQNFLTGFSEIKFTIDEMYGKGDRFAKKWTFSGKHTGTFFGIPASGRTLNLEGMTIGRMENGRIAEEHDFMDQMDMLQQLGVLSAPENMGIIDALYKNFGTGNMDGVLAAMDSSVVWNEAEGNALAANNPYIGPEEVLQGVFVPLGASTEYFKLKDIQLLEMSGNQVLATLRYDAKMKESGKLLDAQAAHLWTLNNGKIIAFQQYANTKALAEAAQ